MTQCMQQAGLPCPALEGSVSSSPIANGIETPKKRKLLISNDEIIHDFFSYLLPQHRISEPTEERKP